MAKLASPTPSGFSIRETYGTVTTGNSTFSMFKEMLYARFFFIDMRSP